MNILTPLYKGKDNVTECNNYRGIKLKCLRGRVVKGVGHLDHV